jgi:large subunit ribosomal protein L29
MKSREIWEMTPDEIHNRLDDAHAELFNLRFQFSIGQMRNSARFSQMRKQIARLNTILRAKDLRRLQEQAAAPAPGGKTQVLNAGQVGKRRAK